MTETIETFLAECESGRRRGFQWAGGTRLPADQILLHHVEEWSDARSIIANGFQSGCYIHMSHLTQRPTRSDDRKGPFAFAWNFSRPMAYYAFGETASRYSYGKLALVMTSTHAAEAFNCSDDQWQVLFERDKVTIHGVIEIHPVDLYTLSTPTGQRLTPDPVPWKTLRKLVKKLVPAA